MVYKVIGLMSGSSLDGLDIVYTELLENNGDWSFEILEADCYTYSDEWIKKLKNAIQISGLEYQLLHSEYGHYLGKEIIRFIEEKGLHYKVGLIASHGHTTFHLPAKKMTAQLGDGAAIAALTGLSVVSDLRALDVAFGGQGAPIVPIGEKLIWKQYDLFLNIGGIANISFKKNDVFIAFDVCPANRVLNLLANKKGKEFDEGGVMATAGNVDEQMLSDLNKLGYYHKPYPKSLANDFGTDEVFPLVESFEINTNDALRTYVEHIVQQIKIAVTVVENTNSGEFNSSRKLLVTGGGAFNTFLIGRLSEALASLNIEVVVPKENIVKYKEALVMALIGVLRWRQEYNVLASVTGAQRNSIGGALWIGQEA